MKKMRRILNALVSIFVLTIMVGTQVFALEPDNHVSISSSIDDGTFAIEDESSALGEDFPVTEEVQTGVLGEESGKKSIKEKFEDDEVLIIDGLGEETVIAENGSDKNILEEDSEKSPSDSDIESSDEPHYYVNPAYADIYTVEDIKALAESQIEGDSEKEERRYFSSSSNVCTSIDELTTLFRRILKNREEKGVISVSIEMAQEPENIFDLINDALDKAQEHTGIGDEGDYIKHNRRGHIITSPVNYVDGILEGEIEFQCFYMSTYDEEQEITRYLNETVYPSLNLSGKTDFEKVQTIYSYITDHVDYDYENLNDNSYYRKHSTYAALIEGTAVCQGYATLLYRMMLDSGVDSRYIRSERHAWNIVKVGELYYNVDSTWDSSVGGNPESWNYFLVTMDDFYERDHQRVDDYLTEEFMARYPMSNERYKYIDADFDVPSVTNLRWEYPGRIAFMQPSGGLNISVRNNFDIVFPNGGSSLILNFVPTELDVEVYHDCTNYFTEEGTYKCRVHSEASDGNGGKGSAHSEWVSINYIKPSIAYETPTNLRWGRDGTGYWDPVSGDPTYRVTLYNNGNYSMSLETTETSYKFFYNSIDEGNWTFTVTAITQRPDLIQASEESAQSNILNASAATNYLAQAGDGNWYLYKNGNIDYSYSGLFCDAEVGWWLVLGGKIAFDYSDLYCDPNYGWWKITNGAVDFGYSDLYCSPTCGWWKISGGAVDFGYTDLYESSLCGWWKISGGAVDFGYTDLYCSPLCGWWKVNEGYVDFGYSDLYYSPTCGWWKISGGAVDFGYTDLYCSPLCGWWKIYEGYVDFGYSDLYYSPSCGWWLVSGGTVDFGYTDIFKSNNYGDWMITGGYVDFGYNGVYNSKSYGNCYVRDGQATFR